MSTYREKHLHYLTIVRLSDKLLGRGNVLSAHVQYGPNESRWKVIKAEPAPASGTESFLLVPVTGLLGAGEVDMSENTQWLRCFLAPSGLLTSGLRYYASIVQGDSMVPDDDKKPGIPPNSLAVWVLYSRQPIGFDHLKCLVYDRDIVVAKRSDTIIIIRQFRRRAGRIWLHPFSSKHDPIELSDDVEILGKVEAIVPEEIWRTRTLMLELPIDLQIAHQDTTVHGLMPARLYVSNLSVEEVTALEACYDQTDNDDERRCCQIILLSYKGCSPPEIAERMHLSDQIVRRTIRRYKAKGLAGLVDGHRRSDRHCEAKPKPTPLRQPPVGAT